LLFTENSERNFNFGLLVQFLREGNELIEYGGGISLIVIGDLFGGQIGEFGGCELLSDFK